MVILTDEDRMPYGKYIGEKLIDVPEDYLIYIYDNNMCSPELKAYIEDNMEVLLKQIKDKSTTKTFKSRTYGRKN